MYVYVTKFEGQPHLLKIGKSVSPEVRNETLSNTHGPIVYSGHYKIGTGYSAVEKYLHDRYSNHRERISGDGGSEFFSDSIYAEVCSYLDKYRARGCLMLDEESIRAKLKVERKRYYNLIGKLLGYGYSDSHTGEWHSTYTGVHDIIKIDACCEIGFPPNEVYSKYVQSGVDGFRKRGFTTPTRVEIAYKLAMHGTEKSRGLESLLSTAIKNNEILP